MPWFGILLFRNPAFAFCFVLLLWAAHTVGCCPDCVAAWRAGGLGGWGGGCVVPRYRANGAQMGVYPGYTGPSVVRGFVDIIASNDDDDDELYVRRVARSHWVGLRVFPLGWFAWSVRAVQCVFIGARAKQGALRVVCTLVA